MTRGKKYGVRHSRELKPGRNPEKENGKIKYYVEKMYIIREIYFFVFFSRPFPWRDLRQNLLRFA